MSKILVTESHLEDIAFAIRARNGGAARYRPGEMAPAILALTPRISPLSAQANGVYTPPEGVDGYGPVTVAVSPVLQEKTATRNGTVAPDAGYDGLSSVTVNVEGGLNPSLLALMNAGYYSREYAGNVYGNSGMISTGNLALLGDFSQGGAASGNALADSIENYTAVLLQGIYQKQRTSGYNTTMMHFLPRLNAAYWAGMKDRNGNYTCNVTFTDATHCSLSGNRQVIIYGMP